MLAVITKNLGLPPAADAYIVDINMGRLTPERLGELSTAVPLTSPQKASMAIFSAGATPEARALEYTQGLLANFDRACCDLLGPALDKALRCNYFDLAHFLVDLGARPMEPVSECIASVRHLEFLAEVPGLDMHNVVNTADLDDKLPLVFARESGDQPLENALLAYGADAEPLGPLPVDCA